jgi:hypothetical protein
MYDIIVFRDILQVIGDKGLNKLLSTLSQKDEWKKQFPILVSAGWHTTEDDKEIHYLKRETLSVLANFLYESDKSFQVRGAKSNEYSPIESFEEWDPPNNQEYAITAGYLQCPVGYHFIVPYYHRNAFGAWREMSPVI